MRLLRARLGGWVTCAALAGVVLSAVTVFAQVAMPDARQMSGVPLPAPDLPNGTVTVRVVRERMGNNLPGQDVALETPDGKVSGVTDDQGRATFTSVAPGSRVTASATVDGETLTSEAFVVPAAGGVRVALVAGAARAADADAAADAAMAKAPARPGAVVFGPDTRIVLEFQDDNPTFFYIFSIVNNARTPVVPPSPLVLSLPADAEAASLVSGPPAMVRIENGAATFSGPFPPGQTAFQLAFRLPLASTLRFTQQWPAPVEGILVAAEKVGGLTLASPQLSGIREGESNGERFIVGTGGRLAEGQALDLTIADVPAPPRWPVWVAIGAVVLGLAWMAWGILGRAPDADRDRHALVAERERLLAAIAALDADAGASGDAGRHGVKRARLLAKVEQIYLELDEVSGGSGSAA